VDEKTIHAMIQVHAERIGCRYLIGCDGVHYNGIIAGQDGWHLMSPDPQAFAEDIRAGRI
jgi:hypothetical protein